MAKITIAGDAVVITSTQKLEDIKLLEKYRPKALCLYETGENGIPTQVLIKLAALYHTSTDYILGISCWCRHSEPEQG